MRTVITILFCLLAVHVIAQLPASCYVDFETGKSGDVMDNTLLNQSVHGNIGTWITRVNQSASALTYAAITNKPTPMFLGTVGVNGTNYSSLGARCIAMHQDTQEQITCTFSSSHSKVAVWFRYNPGWSGASDYNWSDEVTILSASSWNILSLEHNGNANQWIGCHTQLGVGTRVDLAGLIDTANTTWFGIGMLFEAGQNAVIRIYSTNGTLIGESSLGLSADPAISLSFGQNHGAQEADDVSYYDNIIVQFDDDVEWPLLPRVGAELIPSDRRMDWQLGVNVGVQGGIPNRTTIYTNFTATATAAMINAAIANCPSNQVVKLAAGTYTPSAQITFGTKSGVTLRGEGTNTIIAPTYTGTTIVLGSLGTISAGTSITNGYFKGATNLMVTDPAGLDVGDLVRVSQVIDPSVMWSIRSSTDRTLCQYVTINAVSGNTITIWPPLHYGLTPANTPLMSTVSGTVARMSGIEDMVLDATGVSIVGAVQMQNNVNCWMKNVQTVLYEYHIRLNQCLFNEYSKIYINGSKSYGQNRGGILVGNHQSGEPYSTASSIAIYDSMFYKTAPGVEVNGGSSGCIVSYSVFHDCQIAAYQGIGLDMNHGPENINNLYEGNVVNMIASDGYFGGSLQDTVFRNWSLGWAPTFPTHGRCIWLLNDSINENIVGNVLGCTNIVPTRSGNASWDVNYVYSLGWDGSQGGVRGWTATQQSVTNTMISHGNWDSVLKAIAWHGGITNHTIPNSLYLGSKPSWFGTLAWPPVDPANGYTNYTLAIIPAGYRYLNGADPPSDGGGSGGSTTRIGTGVRLGTGVVWR